MIQNNLDPAVAENPDELVVYGGIGKAARNWPAFEAILDSPAQAAARRNAAGAVGQAGRRVPHPCRRAARADRQFQPGAQVGHLGALQRARPRGPDDVRPDDGRQLDLHRHAGHRAGHLRDLRRSRAASTSAATSPAAGCSPPAWAAWAARSRWPPRSPAPARSTSNASRSRIDFRLRTKYLDKQAKDLDEALALIAHHTARKEAVSIGLCGNAAEIVPELARRAQAGGPRPDIVTDQTSAHDIINGYLPVGWTRGAMAGRAEGPGAARAR